MRIRPLILMSVLIALLLPATVAQAWSYKEHILFTRLAVQRLLADEATPPEMKAWLREAWPDVGTTEDAERMLIEEHIGPNPEGVTGLAYWAIYPDFDRGTRVPAFNATEGPMHYIDLEFMNEDPERQSYRHDLSHKPNPDDIPHDHTDERYRQAGYLPFRVEQCYKELVESLRQGDLMPRDGEDDRENAVVWAGMLSHYLADNTQPHHSTIDFRGLAYFTEGRRAPNVHGMMEYGFLDDGNPPAHPQLRRQYWDQFAGYLEQLPPPSEGAFSEPFRSTVEMSFRVYDALPMVGVASMKSVGQGGSPDAPEGAPSGDVEQPDLAAFALHRGNPGPGIHELQESLGLESKDLSVLELKALLGVAAVRRIELALHQAWVEAHGEAQGEERPAVNAPSSPRPPSPPVR